MIFAVPFIPAVTDYKNLATKMKEKGNLLNHVLVVICEAEQESEAFAWEEEVAHLFFKATHVVLPPDERRKAQLANDMFRAAIRYVSKYQAAQGEVADPALMYFDPTYRPSAGGWLDQIQSAYYTQGAPLVFGNPTVDEEEAKIFQGPVVLSKHFGPNSGLLDSVPANIHYRSYLKWEFTNGSIDTNLIGTGTQSVLKPQPAKK